MEWTIEYFPDREAFEVVVSGDFTLEEQERMTAEILDHAAWRPGTPVLFDRRETRWNQVAYSTMREAVRIHEAEDERIGAGKSAIVVASGAAFGLGRQFQGIAEPRVSASLRIFTDIGEARAWLNGD